MSESNRRSSARLIAVALSKSNKNKRRRSSSPEPEPEPENAASEEYTAEELAFYESADAALRRRIAGLENLVGELNVDSVPLRFRVLLSELDDRVKAVAIKRVNSLAYGEGGTHQKVMQWVDGLCCLPIGKYQPLPVRSDSPRADIVAFLDGVRARLDAAVYGHSDAKEHVSRLLAQWIVNPSSKGIVIGVHGPPGVGKTELCKAVCETLGLPFAFVPLGGANDGSYLDGLTYTYEGSTWGKLADVLMKSRVMNPVLFFDELDKVSDSRRGEEIVNLLIHLTDPVQNDRFVDKYFLGVDLDLSKCLCIFSYNDESRVNPILRDRMVRIRTEGYALRDKVRIARDHLLPASLAQFSMAPGAVTIDDAELARIVEIVEEEHGVRNLKRAIQDIVSFINYERLTDAGAGAEANQAKHSQTFAVTLSDVDRFVRSGRRDAAHHKDASRLMMYS